MNKGEIPARKHSRTHHMEGAEQKAFEKTKSSTSLKKPTKEGRKHKQKLKKAVQSMNIMRDLKQTRKRHIPFENVLAKTPSTDSIIYVGTFHYDTAPTIIDLTDSSTSLLNVKNCGQYNLVNNSAVKTVYLSRKQILCRKRPSRSTSLVNLPNFCKSHLHKLNYSASATTLNNPEYINRFERLEILDIPPNYDDGNVLLKLDYNKILQEVSLNEEDHEMIDLIVDLERDYPSSSSVCSKDKLSFLKTSMSVENLCSIYDVDQSDKFA